RASDGDDVERDEHAGDTRHPPRHRDLWGPPAEPRLLLGDPGSSPGEEDRQLRRPGDLPPLLRGWPGYAGDDPDVLRLDPPAGSDCPRQTGYGADRLDLASHPFRLTGVLDGSSGGAG